MLPSGYPCVEFSAKAGAQYNLYRQERDGEPETIAVLTGDENNHVRFVDFSAVPGTDYGYSVGIQDQTGPVLWTGEIQGQGAADEADTTDAADDADDSDETGGLSVVP